MTQTFAPSPTFGWPHRSVIWQTLKHPSVAGKVAALQEWSTPRYRYTASFSGLRTDAALLEWQNMMGFYNSVGGAAQVFFYNDPFDDTATAQAFGIGDAATFQYQLVRALGGFVEPVYNVTITSIFINGVATVAYTESNGLVTFTAAPSVGAVLTWTGTFKWICRFDDDVIEFDGMDEFHFGLKSLSFTTEKI